MRKSLSWERTLFFLVVALWWSQTYQGTQEFQEEPNLKKVRQPSCLQTWRLKVSRAHRLSLGLSEDPRNAPEAPLPSLKGDGDHWTPQLLVVWKEISRLQVELLLPGCHVCKAEPRTCTPLYTLCLTRNPVCPGRPAPRLRPAPSSALTSCSLFFIFLTLTWRPVYWY